MESPVIHQTQAAPASEGHEERYIVPFTVFPGGQDALGCEDARHGEVKACVTDEQVGPLGGATHEPVEPLADRGPLAVSDLGREMDSMMQKLSYFPTIYGYFLAIFGIS